MLYTEHQNKTVIIGTITKQLVKLILEGYLLNSLD